MGGGVLSPCRYLESHAAVSQHYKAYKFKKYYQ